MLAFPSIVIRCDEISTKSSHNNAYLSRRCLSECVCVFSVWIIVDFMAHARTKGLVIYVVYCCMRCLFSLSCLHVKSLPGPFVRAYFGLSSRHSSLHERSTRTTQTMTAFDNCTKMLHPSWWARKSHMHMDAHIYPHHQIPNMANRIISTAAAVKHNHQYDPVIAIWSTLVDETQKM